MKRIFDWKSNHDNRSRQYSIRQVIGNNIKPTKILWEEGTVLDQGSEGACVGFAWTAELLAEPSAPESQPSEEFANALASEFYQEAKHVDEWPGTNYEGTSVLAGAKIMHRKGFIKQYRWCFSVDEVRDALIAEGPVVIGIPWLSGMYETAPGGIVRVFGKPVGGHALVLTGYNPAMNIGQSTEECFRWRNSWGNDYGNNGSGWIRRKDLEKLLASNGEACVPMQRQTPIFKKAKVSKIKRWFSFICKK